MSVYEIRSARGGLSDYEDKGIAGAFKFGANLNIRKLIDSISCNQALKDEGLKTNLSSISPSSSYSPSASASPSPSLSRSPSSSASPSVGAGSSSQSPSASLSPSASNSPSGSLSSSSSVSKSPSPSAGLQTVFADLIRTFIKASDGNTYGFGHTGKIYKRLPDSFWMQVFDLEKPITGAEEKPSSGGKTYLEFATRTEVHRKELPGLSNWNDVDVAGTVQGDTWPKTNLTDQDWHTMKQVAGDVLITNGSMLAMSAYDDSWTNEALDLIPGNIAKTLVERNGRAVIGCYRQTDSDQGINALIDSEVPLAQVGEDGQIVYADFSNTIPMKRFPGGGKVNPGGVCNEISQVNLFDWELNALSWITKQKVGNLAMFGVYGADTGCGGVYSYGRINKNQPFVMNLEYQLDVDEIGAIENVNGITLISYRDGADYGVKAVDIENKAVGVYEGLDFKAPVKLPIKLTVWQQAELFMDALPDGASVEFWYRINKTGEFVQAKTSNGNDSFSVAGGRKATFRIVGEGEIFEPRVVLNPVGNLDPHIYRIRTFFI